jgi:hypothetical protein
MRSRGYRKIHSPCSVEQAPKVASHQVSLLGGLGLKGPSGFFRGYLLYFLSDEFILAFPPGVAFLLEVSLFLKTFVTVECLVALYHQLVQQTFYLFLEQFVFAFLLDELHL